MKLYLVSQKQNNGYDTYDSFVVAANDEEEAKNTHPYTGRSMSTEDWGNNYVWCDDVKHVKVKYLGEADSLIHQGIVCSSFNAG
jgi:hypothetical protein